MNPNSRYEEANILLELKQARVNLRQASDEGHQVKKSQAGLTSKYGVGMRGVAFYGEVAIRDRAYYRVGVGMRGVAFYGGVVIRDRVYYRVGVGMRGVAFYGGVVIRDRAYYRVGVGMRGVAFYGGVVIRDRVYYRVGVGMRGVAYYGGVAIRDRAYYRVGVGMRGLAYYGGVVIRDSVYYRAERHIWALKGLFKSVTKRDPPATESDSSLTEMENETEESNVEAARVFTKKTKEKVRGKKVKIVLSNKRKATSTKCYSKEAKVKKVVGQSEKEDQSCSAESDSESGEDEHEEEDSSPSESGSGEDKVQVVKEIKSQVRNKFECPLRCGAKVYQLPRHLRSVHGWKAERARNAVNRFDMRHDQRNSKKPKAVREKRKQKYCNECGRKQRYLSKHLQKQHGLMKGTKQYRRALKESRPVYLWKDSLKSQVVDVESDTVSEFDETAVKTTNTKGKEKKRQNSTSLKTSLAGWQGIEIASISSAEDDKNSTMEDVQELEGTEAEDAEYLDYDEDESGGAEFNTTAFELNQDSRVMLDKFEKWILSPDGGEKDPKPASLVVRQVQKVLIMLGTENIESLFDKALIRDKFYPESRATVKAGTTISYLHSLRKFYTFAMTEDDVGISQECRKVADALYKKCGEWCKSLSKDVKRRFWEKQEEDLARLITPEKIQEFTKTEFARNQVKTLGQLIDNREKPPALGQQEYCDLRNFLFIHILSQNGHRSGVLTNSTLAEYEKMTRVDGTYMVAVKDHKTFSHHGQANLCFDESLKAWVDIYVKCARNQVDAGEESDALFLNWKGGKMSSSDLSPALTSAWRKSGMIGNDTRISGTLMRKSCTTAVRNHNKEVKGSVAAHMAHSERTADKHYHLLQKRTNSAFAARQLTTIMHGSSSPAVSSHERKGDPESIDEQDLTPTPLARQSWTEEEEKAVQEVFADQISRQSITMREVLALKETHPLLKNSENKRLLDKIRGLYRYKKTDGECLEDKQRSDDAVQDSDGNSIIGPSTNQSKTRVFEEEEVTLFKEFFKDMIQRGEKIEQKVVVQRLKENGHGHIYEKYTKQKVTDKIRGLRLTNIRQWRQ
ncbi:hypothetical protein ACROYT_G035774 [Oculina patagonica]